MESIDRSLRLTRSALDEARRSVLELRAPPLEGRGLLAALRDLAESLHDHAGRSLRVEIIGTEASDALPAAVETGLFHVAREALTNVARHAGTSAVSVVLERHDDHVRLSVADEGRGFDVGAVPADRFGLVGMSERARLLGGTFTVSSAPGRGTAIVGEVPLRGHRAPIEER